MNTFYKTIDMPKTLSNDLFSYKKLIDIYCSLKDIRNQTIIFDMEKTEFVSANLLSILGCILDKLVEESNLVFSFKGINSNIKNAMRQNGFLKHSNINTIIGSNNLTMEYKIFKATTENLEEFEKYTIINIINHDGMPNMSSLVKDRIIDNILEIFNNVIDHAETTKAYVCGQYLVEKRILVVTITDIGKTIKENVTKYLNKPLDKTLKWAITPGNTTKGDTAPVGLGISMLLDFLKLNKGSFTLISGNEILEINEKGDAIVF